MPHTHYCEEQRSIGRNYFAAVGKKMLYFNTGFIMEVKFTSNDLSDIFDGIFHLPSSNEMNRHSVACYFLSISSIKQERQSGR